MKEENPVYVKLEYDEALQSKRDILLLQMNLLKIIKIIKHYRLLRLEELKIKATAYRRLKDLITNLRKIKTNLPKIKVPQLKKDHEEDEFVFLKPNSKKSKKS
jgi:hypothetical protein